MTSTNGRSRPSRPIVARTSSNRRFCSIEGIGSTASGVPSTRSGMSRASSAPAGPRMSARLSGGVSRTSRRRASTNGRNGGPPSARSRHPPTRTRLPSRAAVVVNSVPTLALPMPASPPITTILGVPPITTSSAARSRPRSSSRPTRTGLERPAAIRRWYGPARGVGTANRPTPPRAAGGAGSAARGRAVHVGSARNQAHGRGPLGGLAAQGPRSPRRDPGRRVLVAELVDGLAVGADDRWRGGRALARRLGLLPERQVDGIHRDQESESAHVVHRDVGRRRHGVAGNDDRGSARPGHRAVAVQPAQGLPQRIASRPAARSRDYGIVWLEELAVDRAGRLAVARPGLLAGLEARLGCRLRVGSLARLDDPQRGRRLALDRPAPDRTPLRGVLEAVRLGVAARMYLIDALWLDPHPLAFEEPEDARLARFRALVPAVLARRLVVAVVG